MKVLLSWMREFAPEIDGDPVDLGERMSALGLAVEEMTVTGEGLDGIVLAKVLDLSPHPDADKIQLVQVDAGDGEALQVCCGAFNMAVGDLIPFATIGTVMPNGMEIAQRKMRGQMSNGMCCSAAELGMGDDHEGIMILTDTASEDQLGAPITEALGMTKDILWDLEVNANRPDAMSVAGVTRDLAASLGVPFVFPEFASTYAGELANELVQVDIVDPTLCGRFLATAIRDVNVGTSPQWLANRITALGMRPINRVVDISNYVMLELGQPNHTYDLDLVANGHLRVRRANDGETISTLDDVVRTLIPSDGVIANGADEAVGIAGVMGGANTEISDTTTNVLLEMAWWDPPSISRTVKRLNLPSEAATRYRRGVDWGENMNRAMARFSQLISEQGASVASGLVDESGNVPDRTPIVVWPSKVNRLLGTELTGSEMAGHLTSIGFGAETQIDQGAEEHLRVTIPTWRWDTATETDVAEEVARMFGYENITRTVPRSADIGALTPYQLTRRRIREVLVGAGCNEAHPMPFLAPGEIADAGLEDIGITLTNPLVAEESVLRTSLMPGLLKAISYNQGHRQAGIRLFETGHVFLPSSDQLLPREPEILAVALADEEAPAAVEVLEMLDTALALPNVQLRAAELPGMHPTRSAEVIIAGRPRGFVGEVDPAVAEKFGVTTRVAWIQLDLNEILNGPYGKRKSVSISKHPSSDVDLAFEVPDSIAASGIEGTLRKAAGALLVELELFDTYRGTGMADGSRSLAYRLRFQAPDRTLTAEDVATVRQACIDAAEKQGARLRT